jgi:hypothetical protein
VPCSDAAYGGAGHFAGPALPRFNTFEDATRQVMTGILHMPSPIPELELRIRELERLLDRKVTQVAMVKEELDAARELRFRVLRM